MTDLLSPDFRPRFTDSVSRLTSLSRLFVSRALREDGPDLSRGVDALSRAMFRKASSPALPLSDRLRLLASLHGLLPPFRGRVPARRTSSSPCASAWRTTSTSTPARSRTSGTSS